MKRSCKNATASVQTLHLIALTLEMCADEDVALQAIT